MTVASAMRRMPRAVAGRAGASLAVAAIVVPLVVYPLVQLALSTLGWAGTSESTLAVLTQVITSPTGKSAIWGTLWLTCVTVLLAVPLGVALAWITALTDAPLARRLALLPVVSLAVPPLVGTFGWLILLAPQSGLLNAVVRTVFRLEATTGPFNAYSLQVIVMLMVLYIVPYVYGPVYGAFRGLDASLLDAAGVAGAGGIKTFRTVVLPVVRPAVLAGALIGGVMAASTFVIPLVLASGTGLRVIPTLVYQLVNQEGRIAPAVVLASLLSVLTVIGMLLYLRAVKGGSFVTISGKGLRVARVGLGRWRWAATGVLLLFVLFAIVLPMCSLLYLSLVGYWSPVLFDQPFTLRQYQIMFDRPVALRALINSGWLAAAGASLAVLLGLMIAALHVRRPTRTSAGLSLIATLPLGVPAIVIGLAVLVSYSTPPLVLYGTPYIMVLAYAASQLPIGLRNAEAALRQMATELDEAGRIAGASPLAIAKDLTAPLLRQPLLAAWAICFIILFRDLPISVLLYTPKTVVSSITLLNIFEQGSMPGAAAYGIVIVLVSVAGVIIVNRVTRGRGGRAIS